MPRHITLLLDDLLGGGAARVAAHLSSAWADMGRKVTLLTTDDGTVSAHYPLDPRVHHLPLALRGDSSHALAALGRNMRRLWRLRRALRQLRPDLLISFLDTNNILCLLATRGLRRLPILVSERTDPSARPLRPGWERLRRLTYPWADGLVVQTAHALDHFPSKIRAKGLVIPNPVLLPGGMPSPGVAGEGGRKRAATLGRLNRVKGHDLLIDAFAAIAQDHPDWDLAIHGEGEERRTLEAQIQARGLEGRIRLPGATGQVGARLKETDLFILPSRAEGFPNALAEAMACGLPVISFQCPSGPADLIRDGLDGLLVPPGDVPALASAMARLMASPEERARLALRAPEVLTRFSLERILGLWEEAIRRACGEPNAMGPPES